MKTVILFLRKKLQGQNSMEELAKSLSLAIPNLEIVELPYYSTSIKGMWKNAMWARKKSGDINHIFSITEGYLAPFLKGAKIITVHDLYFKSFSIAGRCAAYLLWELIPSLFTDYYTCISRSTQKMLVKHFPWIKKKTFIIYNPLRDEFYRGRIKTEIRKDEPIILHIGTAYHKNLDKVIKAIHGLRCKLIIVGKLFDDQKELLIKHNIDYDNYIDIDTEQLIKLYQKADIVSFPSRQEGFGMIVIEANAIGIPVIAGDIEVLHEVGQDGAFYITPDNIKDLRDAIIRLSTDKDTIEQLKQKGFQNAERFKLCKIAQHYEDLYKICSIDEH